MSWSLAMTLNIVFGSLLTILFRKLSLLDKKALFVVGVSMYFMIAVAGFAFSVIANGSLPDSPSTLVWIFLFIEGICIPGSFLLQYTIIKKLGAANAVIVIAGNALGPALLGILLLGEVIPTVFLLGALLIFASIAIVYHIHPDTKHRKRRGNVWRNVWPVALMMLLFSIGIFAEKVAIETFGVWNYASFGWAMQFIGASALLLLFGRNELKHHQTKTVYRGFLLGLLTSVMGLTFIYSLSVGALSHTTIAATGKVAITMMLAALLLGERNQLLLRFAAFALSILGLALIFF